MKEHTKEPRILVVDAQGGGIGKLLVSSLRKALPSARITAVGTNAVASAGMLKAGADIAATGENALMVNCRKNDIIVGPIGIVIADSLNGEITPAMAAAVAQADAKRVLIPFNQCDNYIVGVPDATTGRLTEMAVEQARKLAENGG